MFFSKIFKNHKILFSGLGISSLVGVSYLCNEKYMVNRINYYTYKEVSEHNNKSVGIWTTYKDNVYDITDFVENHPGGKEKIMLSAGSQLEPYWNIYKQHLNNKYIISSILGEMKIGKLKDYNPKKYENFDEPYLNEPIRNKNLNFHSTYPCNAETPVKNIMNNWITPNDLWYIRNHHPVPEIEGNTYSIKITGLNINEKELKLKDIKKLFTKNEIISTIQCGGNRRNELNNFDKTSGTNWSYGAISTAKWGGVWLRDILEYCNLDTDLNKNEINHVQFESIDSVKVSIPIEKVLNPYGDVMLAYEMNEKELPRDHGYPLRLIVPGHVGIRNLKWIKKITISTDEVDGAWQSGMSYRPLPSYIKDVRNVDISNYASIQEIPVQSLIIEPINNSVINKDYLEVKGFALSGGGRGIIRVDVSIDGGKTWIEAKLEEGSEQKLNKAWAWSFWKVKFDNIKDNNFDILCKATDASYNTQPKDYEDIWNIRGLNNNAWHRINVKK